MSPEEPSVDTTYQNLRQSLPAIEDPKAFLSSHQVALAQLAFEYCNALMEDRGTISTAAMFPGFNFGAAPATAYVNRNALIGPLIDRIMGIAIQSQPDFVDVRDELGFNNFDPITLRPDNLIDRMIAPNPDPLEPTGRYPRHRQGRLRGRSWQRGSAGSIDRITRTRGNFYG